MSSHAAILVIGEQPDRSAIIVRGLRDAGYEQIRRARELSLVAAHVARENPNAVLIDALGIAPDAVAEVLTHARPLERPVVVFVDDTNANAIDQAVSAGVSGYVVRGLEEDRVGHLFGIAVSRFQREARLRERLEDAQSALEDRKVIERAKGLLMTRKRLSEKDAYDALRRMAMRQNLKLAQVARSVLAAADLMDDL